jgi:spectinomycin phosphotransferase
MREPPKLANATILAALQEHYDLSVTALTFLPIGNDSASFVYRVDDAAGNRYFLKVRSGSGFNALSLLIPRFLHDRGISSLVTPLATISEKLWVDIGNFAISLYPFIEARTAADGGLSEQHWRSLGSTLQHIHSIELPSDLLQIVPYERFIPSRRNVLSDIESAVNDYTIADPIQRELALFWHSQQDQIRTLCDVADKLGNQLRHETLPLVLCHADVHNWNVLLDIDQRLWIVDWDETMLAPKERDLMFVIGGIGRDLVKPYETTSFLHGYGDVEINRRALTYYRYAWALQDIAAYAEQVFLSPDIGDASRRDALHGFVDLFGPGNIVAIATNEGTVN